MRVPIARSASYEGDYNERKESHEREDAEKRLPESDIWDLYQLWHIVPGRVGLSSNLGSLIAKLQMLSCREDVVTEDRTEAPPPKKTVVETPADKLGREAAEAELKLRADRTFVDLEPAEPPVVRKRQKRARLAPRWLYGAPVARGYQPDYIHCSAAGTTSGCARRVTVNYRENGVDSVELVAVPLTLESWVDWTSEATKMRNSVRLTWRALKRMTDEGDGELVVALYLAYSGEPPPSEFKPLFQPKDADLAALVLDTSTVTQHTKSMTSKIRAQSATPFACRMTETPHTAAQDLLTAKHGDSPEKTAARTDARVKVRANAHALLELAGNHYLRAKRLEAALVEQEDAARASQRAKVSR